MYLIRLTAILDHLFHDPGKESNFFGHENLASKKVTQQVGINLYKKMWRLITPFRILTQVELTV